MTIPGWSHAAKKNAKEKGRALVKFYVQARHVVGSPLEGLASAGSLDMDPLLARLFLHIAGQTWLDKAAPVSRRVMQRLIQELIPIFQGKRTPLSVRVESQPQTDGETTQEVTVMTVRLLHRS